MSFMIISFIDAYIIIIVFFCFDNTI